MLRDSIKGTLFAIALKGYYVITGIAFPTETQTTDHLDYIISTAAIWSNIYTLNKLRDVCNVDQYYPPKYYFISEVDSSLDIFRITVVCSPQSPHA